jgi:hypothetical protein
LAQLDSIELGQHHVEKNEVIARGSTQRQSTLAIFGNVDQVVLILQVFFDRHRDAIVIFDYENLQEPSPARLTLKSFSQQTAFKW